MIYMDHNATTPTDPRVLEAMLPYFSKEFANPSSVHSMGQSVRTALERARATVAALISCEPEEIVFTASASESNNAAIKGVVFASLDRGRHVVTTKVEHDAVRSPCAFLEKRFGIDVTYVDVDRFGVVDPQDVARSIREDTVLVSVMHANNEVGTLQPVAEIARDVRGHGVCFHCDAAQTVGKLPVDVETLGVDLLSVSAHKFYGPRGVGALYVRKGTDLYPLVHGGHHERGLRAGTENLPGAVGLAKALEIAVATMPSEIGRLRELVSRLERGIAERIPEVSVNGQGEHGLPGLLNVSFRYVEGESVVLALDMEGIAVSTGSACSSENLEPSHVLSAMGVAPQVAQGSVRFGLGRRNNAQDVDRVLSVLPRIIGKLRAISPLKGRGAQRA